MQMKERRWTSEKWIVVLNYVSYVLDGVYIKTLLPEDIRAISEACAKHVKGQRNLK